MYDVSLSLSMNESSWWRNDPFFEGKSKSRDAKMLMILWAAWQISGLMKFTSGDLTLDLRPNAEAQSPLQVSPMGCRRSRRMGPEPSDTKSDIEREGFADVCCVGPTFLRILAYEINMTWFPSSGASRLTNLLKHQQDSFVCQLTRAPGITKGFSRTSVSRLPLKTASAFISGTRSCLLGGRNTNKNTTGDTNYETAKTEMSNTVVHVSTMFNLLQKIWHSPPNTQNKIHCGRSWALK